MAVLDYLQKVCCFLVVVEVMLQLKPSKQYERYLKVTVGFVCLAIVVLPICKAISGEDYEMQLESSSTFEEELYKAMEEGKEQAEEQMLENSDLYEVKEGEFTPAQEQALKESIDRAIEGTDYQMKRIELKEGKMTITLSNLSGKIRIGLGSEEANLKEMIAKELGMDETGFIVVLE